jgi:hypothetical protein
VDAGVEVLRFELVEPRLHDIFVRHAGAAAGVEAEAANAGARV